MHSRAAALLYAFMSSMALFAAATAALAQTYQGTLRGSVRDAQGVIPGVEVTLTNEETKRGAHRVTNEGGEYVFPSVLPGTYTVRAELPGLQDRGTHGPADCDAAAPRQDFTLQVGGLTEQITVTAEVAARRARHATVATSLEPPRRSARCRSSGATRSTRRSPRRT